jgi:hypothetical protein
MPIPVLDPSVLAKALQDPTKYGAWFGEYSNHRGIWIAWHNQESGKDTTIAHWIDSLTSAETDCLVAVSPRTVNGVAGVILWADKSKKRTVYRRLRQGALKHGRMVQFINWVTNPPAPVLGSGASQTPVSPTAKPKKAAKQSKPAQRARASVVASKPGTPPLPSPMPKSSNYTGWAKACANGQRIRTKIKGMDWNWGSGKPLQVGDLVGAQRDPNNSHDPNAISVHDERTGKRHCVGFLPKKLVSELSPRLPKGARLKGRVWKDRVGDLQEIELWLDTQPSSGNTQAATP